MNANHFPCPVCNQKAILHDVVDFNKSCGESWGEFLPLTGTPVYYALCTDCGHCFAPELLKWNKETFSELIYNNDYIKVDPQYLNERPKSNSAILEKTFGAHKKNIAHLDYGGGNGTLSRTLQELGWDSACYEPFSDSHPDIPKAKKFDLITAYEVFEHVPDPHQLMKDMDSFVSPQGIIFFTTLLSNEHIAANKRISWWYASPRNGHINLYSSKSLLQLAKQYHFQLVSFSSGLHMMLRSVPEWAKHLFKNQN
jgi:SAM-dependent methyltransferase